MLVAVRRPPTEFVVEGNIPEKYLAIFKEDYGDDFTIEEDSKYELASQSEWYKEMKAKETPGGNLRFYRKLFRLTQILLGKKRGISKQKVSNMENGIIPISRKTAYQLGELFERDPGRFI
jgi:DNA-binding XRE family transcriptional regulator